MSRAQAVELIERAIDTRIFPAAVAETGDTAGPIWRQAFGALWYPRTDPSASRIERDVPRTTDDTIFDLASLAKPIATTTVLLTLLDAGAVALDDAVARYVADWRGRDRESVTVRDLLEHASGLPARLIDPPPPTRREFEHDISVTPLEYAPRSKSIYSDLGFILLGFLAKDVSGQTLDQQFRWVWERRLTPASGEFLGFFAGGHPAVVREGVQPAVQRISLPIAPTRPLPGDPRAGRILSGDVHDNYAAALGGVAGHAGLFGNAPAVGRFARAMLAGARRDPRAAGPFAPAAVRLATAKSAVPGSSRALGWDTMLPTSSCGTHLSPAAFGHVGFTGTSLWIDPALDRYFVLLTNRAYGGGTLDDMRAIRRAFHDALATGADD